MAGDEYARKEIEDGVVRFCITPQKLSVIAAEIGRSVSYTRVLVKELKRQGRLRESGFAGEGGAPQEKSYIGAVTAEERAGAIAFPNPSKTGPAFVNQILTGQLESRKNETFNRDHDDLRGPVDEMLGCFAAMWCRRWDSYRGGFTEVEIRQEMNKIRKRIKYLADTLGYICEVDEFWQTKKVVEAYGLISSDLEPVLQRWAVQWEAQTSRRLENKGE